MTQLSVEQAAYVAGVVDGEGCITWSGALRLSIANTKKAWLEHLQQWIGGTIQEHARRSNHRPSFSLSLTLQQSQEALTQISPYLMVKKPQAELFFQYLELRTKFLPTIRRGFPSHPEYVAELQDLRARLSVLNKRGVDGQPYPGRPKSPRLCSLSKCGRPHHSNGYCKQHHKKYIERGGPKWYERPCVRCGKTFVATRSDAVYCSKLCGDTSNYYAHREETLELKRQERIAKRVEHQCPSCQTVFLSARKNARFCSRRCGHNFRRRKDNLLNLSARVP